MALRFGIMALQLEALVPPGLPPGAVMSRLFTFDHAALVRQLHGYGFDTIELGGDLVLFLPQTFAPSAIESLARLKEETGVNYTIHLPLWSSEPSTPLEPVRQGSVTALLEMIRAVQPLDPEVYVLHATGSLAAEFYQMKQLGAGHGLIIRQFQANAMESLRVLLAESGVPSRRLAIETVEWPFELTLEMAEQLDLSMCFDTGHVLVGFSGPVEVFDALERCLPRVAEIHLNDGPWQGPDQVIGYGKDHLQIGAGDLDAGRLMDTLVATDFQGPIIFELTPTEALGSLQHLRRLRPDLFA
jgi:sugar phosphate isomerase/epimerase